MTDKIIDKIRKLLALSQSPNIHEAASAAAMAQKLIEQYNIDSVLLDEAPEPQDERYIRENIYKCRGKRMATWILTLGGGVCKVNNCYHYYSGPKLWAAGVEQDVQLAHFMLNHLIGEVERLFVEEKPSNLRRGYAKAWGHSFRCGAVATINARMQEGREQARRELAGPTDADYTQALAQGNSEAIIAFDRQRAERAKYSLVRVETALARIDARREKAQEFVVTELAQQGVRIVKGPRRSAGYDGSAYQRGREAGKRANIKRGD